MDKTYEFISGMIQELNELFPDTHIHLGGDEIEQDCFDENPGIQQYMTKMGIATYSELIVSHISKVRSMLKRINSKKKAIYWSDPSTLYQKYGDGDILMYWGNCDNAT